MKHFLLGVESVYFSFNNVFQGQKITVARKIHKQYELF